MFKKIFYLFILFSLILVPYSFDLNQPEISRAATVSSLSITQNTTWTLANSPYIVGDDYGGASLWISPEATLTIEAGVVVKFYDDDGIRVDGKLIANGDSNSPVKFTSIYDDVVEDNSPGARNPEPGDWRAIYARNGGRIELDHAIIRYGGYEQYYFEMNDKESIIPNCANAQEVDGKNVGAISVEEGSLIVRDSIITENKIGIEISSYWESDPAAGSEIIINNSQIIDNVEAGIINRGESEFNAIGNWWGDATGPYHVDDNPFGQGDTIIGDFDYYPWLGSVPEEEAEEYPVIIVPGIMGSYLNRVSDDEEIWPDIAEMLLPGDDSYLDELILPESGVPDYYNIYASDIIRNILTSNFFENLIDELEDNGYAEGENLFVLPYDWRRDIGYTAGAGAADDPNTLANKISEVLAKTGADKANIIAHSMGGLVVKKYIQEFGASSIDKFIDIATPHYGSPKAFKVLMFGDDMGIGVSYASILNPIRVKIISQNMPSVFQLLPSEKYFGIFDNNNYYIADVYDYDNNGIKYQLNYNQSEEFMLNVGLNGGLLELAETSHDKIDNLTINDSYNIVGCGQATIGKIYILNKEKTGGYEYGLKYVSGDGTVPLESAEGLIDAPIIYSNSTEHANLPSETGIRDYIASILLGKPENFEISDFNNLSLEKTDFCELDGTQISFHSPIELHVYDEEDNHLGPDENGDMEFGIAGAQYDIIDGNRFVFLPKGYDYLITGQATEPGYFNARVQFIEAGIYTSMVYFNEAPLSAAGTNVEVELSENPGEVILMVDQDGDGILDSEITPSAILNQEESQDIIKPVTEIVIAGTENGDGSYLPDITVTLVAADNDEGSGILKTEYCFDRGLTWVNYESPFVLSGEGGYEIWYASTDLAGNREEYKIAEIALNSAAGEITIDSTIDKVNELYANGLINKKAAANNLIHQLKSIKKQIEIYEKISRTGKFDKIHNLIIKTRLQIVLMSASHNYYKGWINQEAFDIIKDNINSLIKFYEE